MKNLKKGLNLLLKNNIIKNKHLLICPSRKTTINEGSPLLTEAECGYEYRGGLTKESSADTPLMWDKLGNHDNFGNILFVTGYVKGYSEPEFSQIIEKRKKK